MTASVRWIIGLLLLALELRVHGASPGESDARLRAALRTPGVQVTVQFGFDTKDGLDAWDPVLDAAAESKRLEATLSGKTPDPSQWERLARLQAKAGLTNAAVATRARWVTQCREALASRPEDARRMADLGSALAGDDDPEAVRLLRAAAAKSPKDPVCQVALAKWLVEDLIDQVAGIQSGAGAPSAPSAETTARLRNQLAEARQALDAAVDAAPDDVTARIHHMMFHWFRSAGMLGDESPGSNPSPGSMDVSILRGYVLPDLRKAAKLAPDDFRILAVDLWVHAACESIELGGGDAPLSRESRGEAIRGLETLRLLAARAATPEKAAAIWEARGILQISLLQDPEGAAESAAKALELQPSRPKAWMIRAGALREVGGGERLVQFLEQTLQRTNSVQVRLILARMRDREGRSDAAAREVAAALAVAPENLQVRAWDASLRLRKASKETEYAEIGGVLQDCLGKVPTWEPASERAGLMEHLATTSSICMALAGEPEPARGLLKQVLQQFPESDYAGAVQKILAVEPGTRP